MAKKENNKKAENSTASANNKKAAQNQKVKGKYPQQSQKDVSGGQEEKKNVLEMNLAEGQIVNYFDWKKGAFILASMVVLVIIILASIYWGLLMWGEYRAEKNEFFSEQSAEMEKDLEYLKENTADAFVYKRKLELTDQLLNDHVYWTNFFELLEERTFNDVYYIDFQGDTKGDYVISTQARDPSMIDSQVQHLQKSNMIKDIKVRDFSASSEDPESAGEGAVFSLELEVDPEIFSLPN